MEECDAPSLQDTISVQLDEMELLETAYPELVFPSPDLRPQLKEVLATANDFCDNGKKSSAQAKLLETPLISFECPLSALAMLTIRLPKLYPREVPEIRVHGAPSLSASLRGQIASAASHEARSLHNCQRCEPSCMQILGAAMAVAREDPMPTHDGEKAKSFVDLDKAGENTKNASNDVRLGRRLIYSHHIIATQKRTGILKNARDLNLGGYSKIGWPGVIVIEGDEGACEQFVQTLRRWRWKHFEVRGQEVLDMSPDGSLDQARVLPSSMKELGDKESMATLAKLCQDAGLGELFSTLLR